MCCCSSSPQRWFRSRACSPRPTRQSRWSRPARLEEMAREGRRGAASLHTITEDRPRYTNLLLLLRTGAEITATVMVAKVALSTWGFQFWVGVALVP